MDNQSQINAFLYDLTEFLGKYYTAHLAAIEATMQEGYVQVRVEDPARLNTLEISGENEEVTMCFGGSHWHYEPIEEFGGINGLYSATIHSTFAVLNSESLVYVAYKDDVPLGGSYGKVMEEEVPEDCRHYFESADRVVMQKWNQPQHSVKL